MTAEDKNTIDEMDYESMLRRWRFSKTPDRLFQGDTGEYFAKIMKEKREKIGNNEHVQISKRIGF